MNENLLPSCKRSMDLPNRGIHDLIWDICWVGGIHEIQDEPVVPFGNKVLRVVFRCRSACIAECLAVIRFFAGMDYEPRCKLGAAPLVVILRPYIQIWVDLNHCLYLLSEAQ